MKNIRWITRFVSVLVLGFSLVFSALSFVGGTAYDLVSNAIYQATGLKSQALHQAEDLRKLRSDLDESRVARRELGEELVESQAELAASRQARSELGKELASSHVSPKGALKPCLSRNVKRFPEALHVVAAPDQSRVYCLAARLQSSVRLGEMAAEPGTELHEQINLLGNVLKDRRELIVEFPLTEALRGLKRNNYP